MEWWAACAAAWEAEDLSACTPFGLTLRDWAEILAAVLTVVGLLLLFWRRLLGALGATGSALRRLVGITRRRTSPERFDDPRLTRTGFSFVGREADLARLRDAFARRGASAVAVHAPGGYGKTALAIAHARAERKRRRGIWFVDASSLTATRDSLAPLGRRLGIEVPKNAREGIAAVLEAIRRAGGRWLLIHDNLDEPERLRDLADQLRHPRRIDHLITGRIADWPAALATPVPLGLPEPGDATALLAAESGRPADAALAALAGDTLGRHPLALVIAGQVLRLAPGLAVAELANRFAERLKDAPEGREYTKSLFVAVEESWDRLGEDARALLRLAAFLAPGDVSPEHLSEGAAAIAARGGEPLPGRLARLATDAMARAEAFGECRRHALLEDAKWAAPNGAETATYAIHRLTQLVLRERMQAPARARHIGLAARLGAAQFTSDPQYDTAAWPRYHRLSSHAQALAPLAGRAAEMDLPAAANFVHNATQFLEAAHGDLPLVRALRESNLPVVEAAEGRDSDAYAAAIGNFAYLLAELGEDAEAERCFAEAIAVREALTQPGDPSRAHNRNNRGTFFRDRGRYAEAEAEFRIALDLVRGENGEQNSYAGQTLGNLGVLYTKWVEQTGDSAKRAEGLSLNRRALDTLLAALGPMHPATATAHNNLAINLYRIEKAKAALAEQMRAAAIPRAMHRAGQIPEDHPYIAQGAAPLRRYFWAARRPWDILRLGALLDAEAARVAEEHAAWQAARAAAPRAQGEG